MSELFIIEDDNRTVVLSPYFSAGRGFIFPYGQFGEGVMEECFAFPPQEPELYNQAKTRLDSLQVKRPTLRELLQIYAFASNMPIPLLAGKFVSLFRRYPFFAFNPFAYVPKRNEVHGIGDNLEKILVKEASAFEKWRNTQEIQSDEILLDLAGHQGVRGMHEFFDCASKHFFWETEISKVVTCVLRGLETDYNSDWVKGFPIIELESSGVGDFAFYGGTDMLKIVLDFWPHEQGQAYGYTFGIIE